jgi:SAM-dependent methyltransferase
MNKNFLKTTYDGDGTIHQPDSTVAFPQNQTLYRVYEKEKGEIDKETLGHMFAYAKMAKEFMNKPMNSPLDVVGNYEWHQQFPYEYHLMFDNKDRPVCFPKNIIDFGCGPGRMVERMYNYFDHLFTKVYGIDISDYALDYARDNFGPDMFWTSSGIDVGNAPNNLYDMVYSTISMQHIPSRTIRRNIFRGIYNIIKNDGVMSIQMAYHPNYAAGVWSHDTEHATYDSDFWNAKKTNGHADVVINEKDLPLFESDLKDIGFKEVEFKLVDVQSKYQNLNGAYHSPYWSSHWIFIKGWK